MTSFGGHGLRGRTIFLGFWTALSLPNVLALMDAGPVPTAVAAAVALAVGAGIGWVVSQTDEMVGCVFVLLGGFGALLGWTVGELQFGVPVGRHLGALVGGGLLLVLPVLLHGVRILLARRRENPDADA